jgi:hypothetical protein
LENVLSFLLTSTHVEYGNIAEKSRLSWVNQLVSIRLSSRVSTSLAGSGGLGMNVLLPLSSNSPFRRREELSVGCILWGKKLLREERWHTLYSAPTACQLLIFVPWFKFCLLKKCWTSLSSCYDSPLNIWSCLLYLVQAPLSLFICIYSINI